MKSFPFSLIWLALALSSSSAMAEVFDLTEKVWRFQLGDCAGAELATFDDSSWQRVSIPHTWNALDAQDGKTRADVFGNSGYRRTSAWYRRTVSIPQTYADQRTFLRCDGASLAKKVYVNGRFVGQHAGAFTAFCFEITDYVRPGETAQIAIQVDNSEDPFVEGGAQTLAPGRKTFDIAPLRGDFNLYGGIYRSIELVTKPALCISPTDYASSGVYVTTPEVSAENALIRVEAVISVGDRAVGEAVLVATLRDADGVVVAKEEKAVTPIDGARETLQLELGSPRLWSGISDPYLYFLEVSLSESDSEMTDTVVETVGVRSLVFEADQGFVLNGEPIVLRGVNRHQDWQDLGWAIGAREHNSDFAMISEIGANAVRLAHYPQDPYVLNLCDRMGLIVLMEIPLVGWVDPSDAFRENTETQLREMIRQYYNHPSIATWGLWNELMNRAPEDMLSPIPLVQALQSLAHTEDPTRPTNGAANDSSRRAPGLRDLTDNLSWNLYPGWYGDRRPDAMADEIKEKLELDGRAVIGISEYGAGASIYQHEDWAELLKPEPRSDWHPEEYQAYFHERAWRAIESADGLWGSFVWNMFDFAADHRDEGDRPGINDKGLVSHDRQVRKDAFYFYKASWTDTPVLHITSRRFSPRPAGQATVKVYSNAESVTLSVGGRSLGKGTRDDVIHTWEAVDLEPGEIDVVASAWFGGEELTDQIQWQVEATQPKRYATLKFADMSPQDSPEGVTAIEQKVYAHLIAQSIPHAWGVCRLYQHDNPAFYAWLKARDAEGIEIWHHGNRHDRIEGESWGFCHRDEASQRENLLFTQEVLREKTGIVMHTFGAPYNRTDETTGKVLNEIEAIQVMYFAGGSPNFSGLQLNDRVNLEARTGVVNTLEAFKASYAMKKGAEMIVLQGHPAYWNADADLVRLQAILDFLKAEGREFITPWNYYLLSAEK